MAQPPGESRHGSALPQQGSCRGSAAGHTDRSSHKLYAEGLLVRPCGAASRGALQACGPFLPCSMIFGLHLQSMPCSLPLQGSFQRSSAEMQRPPPLDTPESDASLSLEGVRARRNSSLYSVGDQSVLASESSLDGQEDIPAMLTLEVERLLAVRKGWGLGGRWCSRVALSGGSSPATAELLAVASLMQKLACVLAVR